jgi:hypothetical protein
MDMKLELVSIPVSNVDRAKAFYTDQVGFNADHDHRLSVDVRFVQLTPPGSACSIVIGKGITDIASGSAQARSRSCRTSTRLELNSSIAASRSARSGVHVTPTSATLTAMVGSSSSRTRARNADPQTRARRSQRVTICGWCACCGAAWKACRQRVRHEYPRGAKAGGSPRALVGGLAAPWEWEPRRRLRGRARNRGRSSSQRDCRRGCCWSSVAKARAPSGRRSFRGKAQIWRRATPRAGRAFKVQAANWTDAHAVWRRRPDAPSGRGRADLTRK